MQKQSEGRIAALEWLARQLDWERLLDVLRGGGSRPHVKERPAA